MQLIELPNGDEAAGRTRTSCWSVATPLSSPGLPVGKIHAVPRAGRDLAVREGSVSVRCALPVPAAEALHPDRHAAHVVTYPHPPRAKREDIARAGGCRAWAQLATRLDEDEHWAQLLSGGEQQRVAIARAL